MTWSMWGRHADWLAGLQAPSRSQDCPGHVQAILELRPLVEQAVAGGVRTAVELGSGEPPSATAQMLRECGLVVTTVDLHAPADVWADIHDLPFADDAFDLAVARHSLEHCAAPIVALREMRRVAAWALVVVPTYHPRWVNWRGHLAVLPRVAWEHLFLLAEWWSVAGGLGEFGPEGQSEPDVEWRWLLRRPLGVTLDCEPNGRMLGVRRGPFPGEGVPR